MRVLLVEDDVLLGDGIHTGLRNDGYAVDWVKDGETARRALQDNEFHAVILDLGLPKLPGLEVLKEFREQGKSTPVLILTAQDGINDRIGGLDAGADDYLVKPFDLEELCARLRALIRRAHGRTDSVLQHGDLVLDPAAHTLRQNKRNVTLSRREFAVLQNLLENRGRVLSRERLEQSLYGWSDEVESNAVEVYIHHIRKKLGSKLIRTIRGVGYMIDKPQSDTE
ncbi:MAG: response regulator [Gammaproteobacteria bacterium]|nr:response regulator [Gammaproteobacteria bacterium]